MLLAPSDLHKDSQRRLRHAGYHHIKSMPSLAHYLPGSMWKDTFDKLYLWSLYDYSVIAYYDADMLALEDPDSVFNFPLPNATFIGALGSGLCHSACPHTSTVWCGYMWCVLHNGCTLVCLAPARVCAT